MTHGRSVMYASEVMVADLNQDYQPELIFTTYGDPENLSPGLAHGYLVILDFSGQLLYDIELPIQGTNVNGKGAPAAPTIRDLNDDGNLEIIIPTFGAGVYIYSVPGSAENQLIWPTGRGTYLRDGQSPPVISVTPTATFDFGSVEIGQSMDLDAFTVTNTGGGTLTGSVSTSPPFTIVSSGSSFSLGANQSQVVRIRFAIKESHFSTISSFLMEK